ncbi:predicted protein [Naegleria gruberi]|uniref:Predicted protein n=1 Tax=Naegleria gruberi TaxID=5762 RepID=D2VUE2_NAEGR|nr:uncharacterized protein NAEGRDRAFT_72631 [Naegleria gruberi]EFC39610.1 predicted protein [Naegleria gruberi]|eukprot:XP_002672354.1 predicted protein [Naegleria gruberi strain NEG-M]
MNKTFGMLSCLLLCLIVCLVSEETHALTATELLQVRATLLSNVTSIPYSYVGYLFSHGSNSVPIIVGSGGNAVVVAATSSNSLSTAGRICAFGHNGYAYTSDMTSGTAQLLKNCAKWTTKNKANVSYMLHGVSQSGGSTFYNSISGFSLNTSKNAFDELVRPLESVDLLILNLNSLSGEATSTQIQMLSDFLNRGGGIICVTTAWAYSISGNRFPGNVFFSRLGVSFYTAYFEGSPFVASTKDLSEVNAYFKLEQIQNTFSLYGNVSTDDVNTVGNMLSNVYPTLPQPITLNSIETNQKAKTVYDSICGSTTISFPVSSSFQKFCVVMVDTLNKANILPISNNPQVLADSDWKNTIRNYPGPWVEVESDYFVFNVESSYARNLTELTSVTNYWKKVLELYYELSQRPIRDYKERMQIDIDISIGYMHSGYPIMAFQDQNEGTIKAVNPANMALASKTPGRWGHYHELGHNFQVSDWTYSQAVEVTCNIFSLYLEENFPDSANTYGKSFNPPRGLETTFKGNTQDYKGDWTSAGLLFYLDLIQAFGWVSIRKAFAEYYTAASGTLPTSEDEKRDQWVVRYSKIVGRNLGPFCDAWSFPISQSAKSQVSNLTSWMPNNFIVGCSVARFSDSPCASLTIQDNSYAKSTTYEVKIVTWTPVRSIYGERFIFTFGGDSLPQLQTGTTALTLLDGTTSLNSTAVVTNNNGTSITLSTNVVEFVKSGQLLKFSFQAKNSVKIGSFTTSIKILDSKNVLVNVVERPLEFTNSIVIPTSSSTVVGKKSTVTGNSTKNGMNVVLIAFLIGWVLFVYSF